MKNLETMLVSPSHVVVKMAHDTLFEGKHVSHQGEQHEARQDASISISGSNHVVVHKVKA